MSFSIDSIKYEVLSGTLTVQVAGLEDSTIQEISIPTTVEDSGTTYSVISIGDEAFANCSSLTSVVIPDSVTSIGEYAFYDCSNLTSVIIPDSVTSIGQYAFYYCSSLESVEIPDSITSIGYRAFAYCSSLTSVVIPDSVTSIGGSAFSNCSSLESVEIPDSITSIGQYTFYVCKSLISVVIPNSVTSIGNYAFRYCYSLTSVVIGNSVTTIGYQAFANCSKLTSVIIPDSVTSIGSSAFASCTSLNFIWCRAEQQPKGWFSDWNGSSATVYWYRQPSSDMSGGELNYWTEQEELTNGWVISTSGDYFINSENFKVSHDGEIFGTKGLFSGDITSSTVNSNTFAATISSSAPLFECLTTDGTSTTIFPAYYISANSSRLKTLSVENISIQKDSLQCVLQPLLYSYGTTKEQSVEIVIEKVESIDTGFHSAEDTIQFQTTITSTQEDETELRGDITVSLTVRYENIVGGSTTKTLIHVFKKGSTLGTQDQRWVFEKETWAGILIARYNSHSWTPSISTITYSQDGLSYAGIAVTNNLLPYSAGLSLGGPTKAWKQIYCTELDASELWTESDSGNSSDLNKKHSINLLSMQYSDLFDNLQPVTYKYNNGTSNRAHTGFIAQDVLAAIQKAGLTTQDFAGYVEKLNEFNEIERYLRYGEFIALCVDQIQKLKKRVGELETQLMEIKGEE